ncbi:MAG: hypothetical protein KME26_09075 [Oscillatoria princeps RMCB-10]|nr:hypothetical protein [Oscillatoria princeps RMCB-10]
MAEATGCFAVGCNPLGERWGCRLSRHGEEPHRDRESRREISPEANILKVPPPRRSPSPAGGRLLKLTAHPYSQPGHYWTSA